MAAYFLHPLFLLGLGALAAPVVLHLMNRAVPRELVFPTIRFILKGRQRQSGRRSLRDLLVLLLRLAVLAALVLLFAAPLHRPAAGAGGDVERRQAVLFFDLSMSMNAIDFERFVAEQKQPILEDYAAADLALIASAVGVVKVVPFGAPGLRAGLEELEPSLAPGRHRESLAAATQLFSPDQEIRKTVYVFTDLQATDWAHEDLQALGPDVEFKIVQPEEEAGGNLAIAGVETDLFVGGGARRLRATVSLRNHAVAAAAATLRIRAGTGKIERSITVGGEASAKFVLDLPNPDGNEAVAEIELEEAYKLDNSYHFWIGPRPPRQVLVLSNPEDERGKALEGFFLRQALSTTVAGVEPIEVKTIASALLFTEDTGHYDSIFALDSLHALGDPMMGLLKDYVDAGGVLVYVAGRQAADSVGRLNRAGLTRSGFLGVQSDFGQLRATAVEAISPDSGVVDIFARQPGDLRQFPIYRFAQFSPAANARTLLGLPGSYPFLLQEQVGKGALFMFAVSFSPRWSEFPTSGSFLPLLRRIVTANRGDRRGVVAVTPGESAVAELVAAGLPAELAATAKPGASLIEGIPVEVNLSRQESDLRRLEEMLPGEPSAGPAAAITAATASGRDGNLVATRRVQLAWILLIFFCLELAAANFRSV